MPSFKEILDKHNADPQKLLDVLCVDTNDEREQEAYREEFEGTRTRRIKSVGMRTDKTITVLNDDGTESGETKTVYVTKLISSIPQKIVRTGVHFLYGGDMNVTADEKSDAIEEFTRVWEKDLKMQTALKKLARTCMIETKAALLFYPQQVKEGESVKELKLRVRVLDNDSGEFYPHFDDFGDMDAFVRKYETTNVDGKAIQKAVIYTSEQAIHFINENGWQHEKAEQHRFGKIPVVYVEQDEPEWEAVASLIDDYETRISRLADTNDYFAEPLLKIKGTVASPPGKEEVGKMLQFEGDEDADGNPVWGDADYATWDHTPESIKLELETVKEMIFSGTSTPDLSFSNMKGIGAISGVALKLMFMDAMIKREEKGEIFYEAMQRAISVVSAGISGATNIKLADTLAEANLRVEFNDQLPNDLSEWIDTLVSAAGGKAIISQETAASINPLVTNSDEEIAKIKSESTPNESFNI